MAWNKPSEAPKPVQKKPSALRGVVAGLVVVALAAVTFFLFSGKDAPKPGREGAKKTRIREVTPAPAPTNVVTAAKKRYADMTNDEKLQYYVDKYGDNIPPNLAPIVYNLRHPPKGTLHPNRSKYDIFTRRCDREICSLTHATPGTFFVRKIEFDERFDNDFTASVMEKIEILDTDTPEQRQLKEDVIAAKKELLKILKEEGRKPSEVMTEMAATLYDLGQYRESMRAEIAAQRRDGNGSLQDYADLVSAANKMLEAKGSAPIKVPTLAYRLSRQGSSTENKGNN